MFHPRVLWTKGSVAPWLLLGPPPSQILPSFDFIGALAARRGFSSKGYKTLTQSTLVKLSVWDETARPGKGALVGQPALWK